MRISAAYIANFKRIRDVSITPEADKTLVLIGGKNAAGKTSVLDALTAAFGGKSALPADPVRHGADAAEIRVELDGGALTVRRVIKGDGESTLEVRDAEGKIRSPQGALDKLVGARFLDPLAFLSLSPADQRKALLAIIDRDGQVAKLDERRERAFDRRTEVGRDHRKLQAQLDGMPIVEPGTPIDVAAASEEMSKIEDERRRALTAKHAQERAQSELASAEREVSWLEAQIAELVAKLEQADAHVERCRVAARDAGAAVPDDRLIAELDARRARAESELRRANEHNQRVALDVATAERRKQLDAEVKRLDGGIATLTAELARIDADKAAILAANPLPVEGLDVDADGVRFRGVPLSQASGAEQLRVALALAIAAAPELRDVWIRDASLLDDDSLDMLAREAERAGCRCWLERVGDRDPGAIIIQDGRVRERAGEQAA